MAVPQAEAETQQSEEIEVPQAEPGVGAEAEEGAAPGTAQGTAWTTERRCNCRR